MRRFLTLLLLLAVPALAAEAPAPPSFPRGQIVEKVVCAANPEESYSLYLPSGYTPDRAWPVLYIMDPRARGARAAERFRAGAEKLGYILVSSNSSMSDGPMEPNLKSMRAMWPDTHERFRIDDRRVYGAGFSGTVRSLITLARVAPGTMAGIVGAGAGFPFGAPPRQEDGLVFYGTLGDKDFNYYEMMDLEPKLAAAGLPHRVEIFDGTHQWPPETVAGRALAWMDLQAMKAGTLPKNPAFVDAFWTETLERARASESADDLFQAHRTFSGAAIDFAGLRDVTEAQQKTAELAANSALQTEWKKRAERLKHDKEFLELAPGILSAVNPSGEPKTVAQVVAALKIHEWRKKAQSAKEQEERLSAQRILNTLWGQTASYIPGMFIERKQYDKALFMLSIAAEIDPENAFAFYRRASVNALKGDGKRALADLRLAVEKGFRDAASLEKDADFDSLRQEKGYQEIVKAMKETAPAPGSGR